MSLFDFFRAKPAPTAATAKERLQVVISHERRTREGTDYLPKLKEEIIAVIRKYQTVADEDVNVQLERQADCEILELNITLNQG